MGTFYQLTKLVMKAAESTPEKKGYTSLDASMGFKPATTKMLNEQRIAASMRLIGGSVSERVQEGMPYQSVPEAPQLTPAQRIFSMPNTGARLLRPPGQGLVRGGIGHPQAGYRPAMTSATMAIEVSRGTVPHVGGPTWWYTHLWFWVMPLTIPRFVRRREGIILPWNHEINHEIRIPINQPDFFRDLTSKGLLRCWVVETLPFGTAKNLRVIWLDV